MEFTFYKDNRIDGEYKVNAETISSKFVSWLSNHKDKDLMLENLPYRRITESFMVEAGHIESSQFNDCCDFLESVIRNDF